METNELLQALKDATEQLKNLRFQAQGKGIWDRYHFGIDAMNLTSAAIVQAEKAISKATGQ